MDVDGTKYLTMFLLGIVPLILGFLPLKVGKQFYNNDKPWKRTFTSVLLCYGGGLLLATASIHILPEVRETLEKADYVWLKDRPFGEIFTAIGFFIIYFIEEFVHYFLDSSIHHHHRYVLNFRNLIYSTNFLSTFQCLSSSSQIIHCSYQCLWGWNDRFWKLLKSKSVHGNTGVRSPDHHCLSSFQLLKSVENRDVFVPFPILVDFPRHFNPPWEMNWKSRVCPSRLPNDPIPPNHPEGHLILMWNPVVMMLMLDPTIPPKVPYEIFWPSWPWVYIAFLRV